MPVDGRRWRTVNRKTVIWGCPESLKSTCAASLASPRWPCFGLFFLVMSLFCCLHRLAPGGISLGLVHRLVVCSFLQFFFGCRLRKAAWIFTSLARKVCFPWRKMKDIQRGRMKEDKRGPFEITMMCTLPKIQRTHLLSRS